MNLSNIRNHFGKLGGWSVGLYLFSVPVFSYSPELSLGIVPQVLGFVVVVHAIVDITYSQKLRVGRDIQCYALFAIWAVVTLGLSDVKGSLNDLRTVGTMVKVAVVSAAATQVIRTRKEFFVALAIYNCSIFAVTYLNYELLQDLRSAVYVRGDDRFEGTLANANVAAMYALSVVWASITLCFCSGFRRPLRVLFLFSLPPAAWIIGFSGSRKGLLGIVILSAMISWWVVQRHRRSFVKFVAAVIVSASLLAGSAYYVYHSPFFFRLERLFSGDDIGTSANERLYLAESAITLWTDNVKTFVIGVGYDNFRFYNQLQAYSHSTITETLVCTGIVGFVLYVGALYVLSRRILKLYRHSFLGWMSMSFVLLFVFFNIYAVMCASREFWPLIGMISSYSLGSARSVHVWTARSGKLALVRHLL